jgi:hypothetical protein
MERFAGGAACEADRASVQRGKEGERWKGVPGARSPPPVRKTETRTRKYPPLWSGSPSAGLACVPHLNGLICAREAPGAAR